MQLPSRSQTRGISTALYQRGDDLFLIAANPGEEIKAVEVKLDLDQIPPGSWQVENLVTGDERSGADLITFPIPRKDGVILRLNSTDS